MRRRFVIHEHHARRLHFDLRLEIDGVLKSWAIPKGPSLSPKDKRLAVAVPDHSLSYIGFEGEISEGSYGAGPVRIWDGGHYETKYDPARQVDEGKLVFLIFGLKLRGEFALVKIKGQDNNWLLIKAADAFAQEEWILETVLAPKKRPAKRKAVSRSSVS
ncbi:MAG: DNA polymerase ligase N-terminal domain-containing protein [Pyrinomonadaceae bacterium]